MPVKKIEMTLRVKGCDTVFSEDLGPGVLVVQGMVFKLPKDYSKVQFAQQLLHEEDELLKSNIEVVVKEVPLTKEDLEKLRDKDQATT